MTDKYYNPTDNVSASRAPKKEQRVFIFSEYRHKFEPEDRYHFEDELKSLRKRHLPVPDNDEKNNIEIKTNELISLGWHIIQISTTAESNIVIATILAERLLDDLKSATKFTKPQ